MTDNEIIKALSDRINRQKAEIERLKSQNTLLLKKKCKEPKQGKWIPSVNKNNFYVEICSECGYIEEWNLETDRNFCPNCGAKMKVEK